MGYHLLYSFAAKMISYTKTSAPLRTRRRMRQRPENTHIGMEKHKMNRNDYEKELEERGYKPAEVYMAKEAFLSDKAGNILGRYVLTESVLTALPLDPKRMFRVYGKPVETWILYFFSITRDAAVGKLEYYEALNRLRPFSVGEKGGYLIVKPLTTEDQEQIVND